MGGSLCYGPRGGWGIYTPHCLPKKPQALSSLAPYSLSETFSKYYWSLLEPVLSQQSLRIISVLPNGRWVSLLTALVGFKEASLSWFLQRWSVHAPTAIKQTPHAEQMGLAWSPSPTWMELSTTSGPASLKQSWFLLENPSIAWVQKICVTHIAAILIIATKLT